MIHRRTVLAGGMALATKPVLGQEVLSTSITIGLDFSASMKDYEMDILLHGTRAALTTQEFVAAAEWDPVALHVYFWSDAGPIEVHPWTVCRSRADLEAFGQRMAQSGAAKAIEQKGKQSQTNISWGIRSGTLYLMNGPPSIRKVMDICGDGKHSSVSMPSLPRHARDEAEALDILINGIAIMKEQDSIVNDVPGHYRAEVITTGGQVFTCDTLEGFADAMMRKLRSEYVSVPRPSMCS